jgi:AcrR family transcriptional regulator
MGISERREREKTERRRAILECAKELILVHGVQRVSMEEIAYKAELSKATVYLYFHSKDILFNEICEEAARVFLNQMKSCLETSTTGIAAMKCYWFNLVSLLGNIEDMEIVLQVRKFIDPGQPIISLDDKDKSPNVNDILETIKTTIEQCKVEGIFDPNLDSYMAARLLLSMFSFILENNARKLPGDGESSVSELAGVFQILLHGFAKEGIERSCLDITSVR